MENKNLLTAPISDTNQIKKLLPHREPMIMVDTLVFFSGTKCVSQLTILNDNVFVYNRCFTEAGILEHMAQTAALHSGYKQSSQTQKVKEGFIASIKSSEIKHLPKVNDCIKTELEIIYDIGHMSLVKLNSFISDTNIATAEMSLVLNEN